MRRRCFYLAPGAWTLFLLPTIIMLQEFWMWSPTFFKTYIAAPWRRAMPTLEMDGDGDAMLMCSIRIAGRAPWSPVYRVHVATGKLLMRLLGGA
jgi:hypothetical protein